MRAEIENRLWKILPLAEVHGNNADVIVVVQVAGEWAVGRIRIGHSRGMLIVDFIEL